MAPRLSIVGLLLLLAGTAVSQGSKVDRRYVVATESPTELERVMVAEPQPENLSEMKERGYRFIEFDGYTVICAPNVLGIDDTKRQIQLMQDLTNAIDGAGPIDLGALTPSQQQAVRGMFNLSSNRLSPERIMANPDLKVRVARRADVWFERNGQRVALSLNPNAPTVANSQKEGTVEKGLSEHSVTVPDQAKFKHPSSQLDLLYPGALSLATDKLRISGEVSAFFTKECDELRKTFYKAMDELIEKLSATRGTMTDAVIGDAFDFAQLNASQQNTCAQDLYNNYRDLFSDKQSALAFLQSTGASQVYSEPVLAAFYIETAQPTYVVYNAVMSPFRCPLGPP
jgi:hypothetical protein